jgi:hypothetical protein
VLHAVIGLGEVGGAILANLQDSMAVGCAQGYDLENFEASKPYRETCCHWLHVCIPGGSKAFVSNVVAWATSETERIIVHASTPPGVCRALSAMTGLPVTHSPVNGKHVTSRTMETYIKTLPKFFAGPGKLEVTQELRQTWDICWLGDNQEITELMKLLATTYYGLLINWTQFVHNLCADKGLPYDKVMSVFTLIDSKDWRIDNKYPGRWGGHCIESNFKILKDLYPNELLLKAMHALNEEHGE